MQSSLFEGIGVENKLRDYLGKHYPETLQAFITMQEGVQNKRSERRSRAKELGLEELNPKSLKLPIQTQTYPGAYERYRIREYLDSVMHVANENNATVMLGLLDAKNLKGVNDRISIAAGDLYLLACISIIHKVSKVFFRNSCILRRTTGDEFWLVCNSKKYADFTILDFRTLLAEEIASLSKFTGLEDLPHPRDQDQNGIGLHSSLVLSTEKIVHRHNSTVKRWGTMIDFCEDRLKT